ncbi:MAG: hypothetical protein ABSA18_11560, partial [Dehalococcoidia bacterium]
PATAVRHGCRHVENQGIGGRDVGRNGEVPAHFLNETVLPDARIAAADRQVEDVDAVQVGAVRAGRHQTRRHRRAGADQPGKCQLKLSGRTVCTLGQTPLETAARRAGVRHKSFQCSVFSVQFHPISFQPRQRTEH